MQYVAFYAVVILYVQAIQKHAEPPEVWAEYLEAGEYCQKTLAPLATEDSLVQRYMIVLEELRIEATTRMPSQSGGIDRSYRAHLPDSVRDSTGGSQVQPSDGDQQAVHGAHGSAVPVNGPTGEGNEWVSLPYDSGVTPDSLTADLTSWGYFDSLVRLCFRVSHV
jgi:hypothetical protein